MDETRRLRVLVIDDEEENIRAMKVALGDHWDVEGLTDPEELKRLYDPNLRYDLIFLDLLFDQSAGTSSEAVVARAERGELAGLDFLDWLCGNHPTQPVAVYSAFLAEPIAKRIRKAYPHVAFTPKPVDFNAPSFRDNMEYYARRFVRFRFEDLGKKEADRASANRKD